MPSPGIPSPGERPSGGQKRETAKTRLDKYLSKSGELSRKEAAEAIRRGRVTVDGVLTRDPARHIDETAAKVALDGVPLAWEALRYVMLNKPAGVVSSTEEKGKKTVLSLLPPSFLRWGMFPCGRLDIDTVGLLLITNDGAMAHNLLAPKKHIEKTYRFRCASPLHEDARLRLENGLDLGDFTTKPCRVRLEEDGLSGDITLSEGKFHQIKRMLAAVGSEITFLERIRFGPLILDDALARGAWRFLTEEETAALLPYGKRPPDGQTT